MAKYRLRVTDGNKSLGAHYPSIEGNDVIYVSFSLHSEWQWHPSPVISGKPRVFLLKGTLLLALTCMKLVWRETKTCD